MSRATDLLEQATPLPWTTEWTPQRWSVAVTDNGQEEGVWADAPRESNDGSYRENRSAAGPDAALIVYAVNRLPDYEAAVEALERLLNYVDARLPGSGPLARDEAHRVIARLRDKVPS